MRRMCANSCGKPAVYVRRGRRKSRNDHDLCAKCWRAVLDEARARREEVVENELFGRQKRLEIQPERFGAAVGQL